MNQSTQRPCDSLKQSDVSMKKQGQLVINILLYILLLFPITSFFKDKVSFLNPALTGITVFYSLSIIFSGVFISNNSL